MLNQIKEEETNIVSSTILGILLDFEDKQEFLPQNIIEIIQNFENDFSALKEFDKKSDKLIELKNTLLEISRSNSKLLNDELIRYIEFICIELCMYSDIYKGFFYIQQIPQARINELYLSHLYTASDCFEGFIYRLSQLKLLANYKINDPIKAICLIICNFLNNILLDSQKFIDDNSSHASKVAIRRTCIAGLYLAQDLIDTNKDEDLNNSSKTKINTDWSSEDEEGIEQLISNLDEWSKIDYSSSEEKAWDKLRKTLNF